MLLILALLGESYPAELVRLLGATKASILQILEALELEGTVDIRDGHDEARAERPRGP